MSRRSALAVLGAVCLAGGAGAARAGHEFPFYPSFYPQEIRVEPVPPAEAGRRLADGTLHAYVGADPFEGSAPPPHVGSVESLGAYVVVTMNPRSPHFADPARRCRAARAARALLTAGAPGYRPHPYVVTPLHADHLQHADLAEAAREPPPAGEAPPRPRLWAEGALAERIVPTLARTTGDDWDAAVQTVDLAGLVEALTSPPIAWGGGTSPWRRQGWLHAYLLQAPVLADPATRQEADALLGRLVGGETGSLVERLNLERALVTRLARGCERLVAGYTARQERLHVEYSAGVENVARDALFGLASPIFPRTAKLKDFPWNGWLTVGVVPARSDASRGGGGAADLQGRLVWSAAGDPAFFPSPLGPSFVPNRVTLAPAGVEAGPIEVPAEALAPSADGRALAPVGPGKRAQARVTVRVLASKFHDGTRMAVPDALYALVVASRVRPAPAGGPYAALASALANRSRRLVGVRPLRVETDTLAFGEDKLTYEVPVIEVYVDHRAPDPLEVATVAPPWGPLPWHLLALMEEAERTGLVTITTPLDLGREPSRDSALAARLGALVDDLGRRGHVPSALAGRVSPAEARARFRALRQFLDAHRHLLVTSGPYRLESWTDGVAVLKVFRDLSYPRGVGAFNAFATPLRAHVTRAELVDGRLLVEGDVEKVERAGRDLTVVREPFVKRAVEADKRSLPVAHYVVVGPGREVVAAGVAAAEEPGTFRVDLGGPARAGRHTVLVGLAIDDNRTDLPVKALAWTR